MGPLDLINHVLNFVAPAACVALLTVSAGRWLKRKSPAALSWLVQTAINFVANVLIMLVGLWFFGRDGKMATYAALVLTSASVQWVLARGWRG